jgi:hypothetical protein
MRHLDRITKLEQKYNGKQIFQDNLPYKYELKDFLTFEKFFFPLLEGQEFKISQPLCREPHQIILARTAHRIIEHDLDRVIVNIPPSSGKTTWAVLLGGYGLGHFPRSRFIYISYEAGVAITQSNKIRLLVNLPEFERIFGVSLSDHTRGKEFFITNHGGMVYAAGSMGAITSKHAGLKHTEEFGGCIFIDDFHKPVEIHSDLIREREVQNFHKTIRSRTNSIKTPIVFIGQRLHEGDLPGLLYGGEFDTRKWEKILIPGLDPALNSWDPAIVSKEELLKLKDMNEYVFYSQYQQDPQPAGGGIFKLSKLTILDNIPDNIIATFITVDTAETSKTFNDATAFSFWGIYRVKQNGLETNQYALHWLNCWEIRVEPDQLENHFMQFYFECCRFKPTPIAIGVEKKSTGTTLLSVLQKLSGVSVVDTIPYRHKRANMEGLAEDIKYAVGRANKIDGFLACQSFVHSGRVTFIKNSKISDLCINHLTKITANDTHMHDDIADTMRDAINMGLMTDFIVSLIPSHVQQPKVMKGYKAILPRTNT